MIWRIRERSVVARVSRDGRRVRAGVLWCTCLFDPEASPPRVAFAIGRAIGPSVVRNRVRRRLRAALSATSLPPGNYLVGARPDVAARSFDELMRDVTALVASAEKAAVSAPTTSTRPPADTNTRSTPSDIDPASSSGS
ncbi:MAG: ribonuclease P protein component [Ilumatobacteraceae bacterium]